MHGRPRSLFSRRLGWLLFSAVLCPPFLFADSPFLAQVHFPLEHPPGALQVDDFNRDGQPDVAVAHEGEGLVSVLLSLPDAADLLGRPTTYEVGNSPVDLTSGDLNGDDAPDLLVVNIGSSTVDVLLNQGNGTFLPARESPAGNEPRVGQLADLNGDGALDAITTNFSSHDISVFFGDGKGNFPGSSRLRVGDNPHCMTVDDLDADGVVDIVVAHSDGISFFRDSENGEIDRALFVPLSPNPRLIANADLDHDGLIDVAVVDDGWNLFFLRNAGGMSFNVRPVLQFTDDILIGRLFNGTLIPLYFDEDDFLDLAVQFGRLGNFGMRILHGAGDGTFPRVTDLFIAPAFDLCFHDFDADGHLDLLLSRADEPFVSLVQKVADRTGSRVFIPLEQGPRDVVVVDVDGNGTSDAVATSSSTLHLLKTTTRGGLEEVEVIEQPGRAFQRMEMGDFDGDGKAEMALTDFASASLVVLWPGKDGTIKSSTQQALHVLPTEIVSADFDRDGVMDLVVTDQGFSSATVVLHPGVEEGGELVELPVGGRQTAVDAGDVDGDGSADVVLATIDGLWLFFGNGEGDFPRTKFLEGFPRARGLRLGDLEGDGTTELVVALQGSRVVVLERAGSDDMGVRVELETGREVRPLAIQDVDSDGRLDLLAAGGSGVVVFRAQADGGFERGEIFVVGDDPRAMDFGDFNADGQPDLITADFGSRGLSILSGSVRVDVKFTRGDTDLSGEIVLTDAVVILRGLFGGAGRLRCDDAADVDDNGEVNLSDPVYLLNYLFRSGAEPPAPFPEVGEDPTADGLSCERP